MLNAQCPLPAVLPSISAVTCPQEFGQIQKLAFRLIQDPAFADFTDIIEKTIWETLITSILSTKIVISPSIPGIVIPNSETLTEEGGNNNTLDGISMLVGKGNVKVTGKAINMPVSVAKQLEALTKFSNVSGTTLLEAYFFNEAGQIIFQGIEMGEIALGFPIYNFTISSVGSEGYNKPNTHIISWEMKGDWDKNLAIASPMVDGTPSPWDPRKL